MLEDGNSVISKIQQVLRDSQIPAWLFYDFRGSDPISYQILKLDSDSHPTRRWFYLVPAEGDPRKLVHRIESDKLDRLPGKKRVYLRWQQLHSELEQMLEGLSSLAMQYSEKCALPYVSYVDAGTIELVRASGPGIVSSADLIQRLEAVCQPLQLEQHRRTAGKITRIVKLAFEETAARILREGRTTEFEIQQFIMNCFKEDDLETDYPPVVAVNQNSSNPHYCPAESQTDEIESGDFLLIDLWAKAQEPTSIFADITWTAFFSSEPPKRVTEVFEIVKQARDRGVEFLRNRLPNGEKVLGCEVDDAVRKVIREAGLGEYFTHRTGHNLGREVHGSGANFDNLETHDDRQVIPGLLCTIEPGVYLPEFGVRSEINIHITPEGPEITTPPQDSVLTLPCG